MGEQMAGLSKVVLLIFTRLTILVMYLQSLPVGEAALRIGGLAIEMMGSWATRPSLSSNIQAGLGVFSRSWGRFQERESRSMQGLLRPRLGFSHPLSCSLLLAKLMAKDEDIGFAPCWVE